jgi:hypothetical protein
MRPAERRATDALVGALHWLAVDTAVTERADALARRYARSHSGIDALDYCVAASALVHGLDLWTLNIRHFPMFQGLRPPCEHFSHSRVDQRSPTDTPALAHLLRVRVRTQLRAIDRRTLPSTRALRSAHAPSRGHRAPTPRPRGLGTPTHSLASS